MNCSNKKNKSHCLLVHVYYIPIDVGVGATLSAKFDNNTPFNELLKANTIVLVLRGFPR